MKTFGLSGFLIVLTALSFVLSSCNKTPEEENTYIANFKANGVQKNCRATSPFTAGIGYFENTFVDTANNCVMTIRVPDMPAGSVLGISSTNSNMMKFEFINSAIPDSWYYIQSIAVTITKNNNGGRELEGNFSGVLKKLSGASNLTVNITDGYFYCKPIF